MICYFFSILFALNAHLHPVHVSVLNIDYSKGKPTIDLSFKVFSSDIELAVAHNYNVALNLTRFNEDSTNTTQINKYVSQLFTIQINNNEPSKLVLKKKEINEDAVWLYYTIPVKKKVKELLIRNLLLMDIYMDQTNLVIVSINGEETGYKFDYKKQEFKIKI
jgi:hypothetical protein